MSRLVELSAASSPTEPLSELELHRGWRNVEQRAAGKSPVVSSPAIGSRRRWVVAAVGLAAAAGVLFIVIGPQRDATLDAEPPSREQVAEMGEQVHATLQALDDGKSDSERAAELAAEYQRRLAIRQEQDG